MLRKLLTLFLSFLLLCGCSSSASNNASSVEKTYDEEFMTALAKGLEERWEIADSNNLEESAELYASLEQSELDCVEEYSEKKFKDTKLQELAIAFINELKNGIEVAKKYGADSFYTDYINHQNKRTKILYEINQLKEIPVKNVEQLNELLAQGKEVGEQETRLDAIKSIILNLEFTLDDSKSDEYSKVYSAVAENTTSYNVLSVFMDVNLKDSDGVNIGTEYVSVDNWNSGEKARFEFTVFGDDANFTSYSLSVDDYSIDFAD